MKTPSKKEREGMSSMMSIKMKEPAPRPKSKKRVGAKMSGKKAGKSCS